jgi:NitT/TauT family transport system permease protein
MSKQMIRSPIKRSTRLVLAIGSIAAIILLYSILSYRQHQINPTDTTIPNWKQFADGITKIVTKDANGRIWLLQDLKASGGRLLLGLLVGVVSSMIVGIAMSCWTSVAAILSPPIAFLSRIPPTAMLAIYFVLFGTDTQMFVAIVSLGIFPTLTMSIYNSALKDVQEVMIHKAYTLGASNAEVIYHVVLKQILPRVLQFIQMHLGPAMVFLIAAEMMVADVGFGYRLRIQSRLLNMNVVYSYVIILGMIGFAMDRMLLMLRLKLCKWYGE